MHSNIPTEVSCISNQMASDAVVLKGAVLGVVEQICPKFECKTDLPIGCTVQRVAFYLTGKFDIDKAKEAGLEIVSPSKLSFLAQKSTIDLALLYVRLPSVSPLIEWTLEVNISTSEQLGPFRKANISLGFARALGLANKDCSDSCNLGTVSILSTKFLSYILYKTFYGFDMEKPRAERSKNIREKVKKYANTIVINGAHAQRQLANQFNDGISRWLTNTFLDKVFAPREYFILRILFKHQQLRGLSSDALLQLWTKIREKPMYMAAPRMLVDDGVLDYERVPSTIPKQLLQHHVSAVQWLHSISKKDVPEHMDLAITKLGEFYNERAWHADTLRFVSSTDLATTKPAYDLLENMQLLCTQMLPRWIVVDGKPVVSEDLALAKVGESAVECELMEKFEPLIDRTCTEDQSKEITEQLRKVTSGLMEQQATFSMTAVTQFVTWSYNAITMWHVSSNAYELHDQVAEMIENQVTESSSLWEQDQGAPILFLAPEQAAHRMHSRLDRVCPEHALHRKMMADASTSKSQKRKAGERANHVSGRGWKVAAFPGKPTGLETSPSLIAIYSCDIVHSSYMAELFDHIDLSKTRLLLIGDSSAVSACMWFSTLFHLPRMREYAHLDPVYIDNSVFPFMENVEINLTTRDRSEVPGPDEMETADWLQRDKDTPPPNELAMLHAQQALIDDIIPDPALPRLFIAQLHDFNAFEVIRLACRVFRPVAAESCKKDATLRSWSVWCGDTSLYGLWTEQLGTAGIGPIERRIAARGDTIAYRRFGRSSPLQYGTVLGIRVVSSGIGDADKLVNVPTSKQKVKTVNMFYSNMPELYPRGKSAYVYVEATIFNHARKTTEKQILYERVNPILHTIQNGPDVVPPGSDNGPAPGLGGWRWDCTRDPSVSWYNLSTVRGANIESDLFSHAPFPRLDTIIIVPSSYEQHVLQQIHTAQRYAERVIVLADMFVYPDKFKRATSRRTRTFMDAILHAPEIKEDKKHISN